MKRSAFKPRTKPMARSEKPLKPIGARAKRMRQGKVPPTVEEQAWMDAIVEFGCIVCWLQRAVKALAEVHHLKRGDRRMGHLFSLGLCYAHHRGGAAEGSFISRHPYKARFELAYGTEEFLLEKSRELLKT